MDLQWQSMLFQFFGGLGIFLFGIKYMGDGLQKSAGERLREILDRFTTNPFMGVLAGIVVTMLLQTSSGTTVLTIGLVSAGFMNLRQAIGVIMGANIGTTITAFIIGIEITEYALPIIFIGAVFIFFIKNKKVQYFGQIVFGFGALFFGLDLMTAGMSPLGNLEMFRELTINMSQYPVLGVVIGTVITLIVQSSSVTIGILQGLYAEGLISLDASLSVLFGDNIGTTITAVLAAIGSSLAARRAAAIHVLFNLIGTAIFLVFLPLFLKFVMYIESLYYLNPKMTIAVAHGTFNITNTIIQFPFIFLLIIIVTKLIPGEDHAFEFKSKHLDPLFIEQSTAIALGQAKEEVLRMGQFAVKGLQESKRFLETKHSKHADAAYQLEEVINNIDTKITNYLVKISATSLTQHESERHSILVNTVRDIERIGDHFENILELVEYGLTHKVTITDEALQDLDEMFEMTIESVQKAIEALDFNDLQLANIVAEKEEIIDNMERQLRKKHIIRLNEGKCSAQGGIIFVDIVSNLERIGDHAVSIAEVVLGVE